MQEKKLNYIYADSREECHRKIKEKGRENAMFKKNEKSVIENSKIKVEQDIGSNGNVFVAEVRLHIWEQLRGISQKNIEKREKRVLNAKGMLSESLKIVKGRWVKILEVKVM